MITRCLGTDVGLHGALSIVATTDAGPRIVSVLDIPLLGSKGASQRVNVLALQEWLLEHGPQHAFIEAGQPMPRQGVSSTFRFGRACGAIETVIALPVKGSRSSSTNTPRKMRHEPPSQPQRAEEAH